MTQKLAINHHSFSHSECVEHTGGEVYFGAGAVVCLEISMRINTFFNFEKQKKNHFN